MDNVKVAPVSEYVEAYCDGMDNCFKRIRSRDIQVYQFYAWTLNGITIAAPRPAIDTDLMA